MRPPSTIEGTVERVAFASEENGWSVVRLIVRGQGQVTAVGHLLGVQPGESLRLTGQWVRDRKYGQQFRVDSYLLVTPSTFVGIEKYLSSGLIAGIGPELAKRLVQHFGLETLEVIDQHPQRLTEVAGVGRVRSTRIRAAWDEQRAIRQVMVFLQSYGVSSSHAVKIYKRYGERAVALVRENPYRLAQEIHGIGFRSADKIARELGIPVDAPQRSAAGALHALSQAIEAGHVFLPLSELIAHAAQLLELEPPLIATAVDGLLAAAELQSAPLPGTLDRAIYLPALELAEREVAAELNALTAQQPLPLQIRVDKALQWFERREQIELAPEQRRALELALTSKVMILSGGPGTGKTTLVRGIVSILETKGLRVLLAAPTGKAAKRLSEATGREAKTLHRLLEFQPQQRGFARGPAHPLAVDLLVIDEASMLDLQLTRHVVQALPRSARLILVGDIDQLPAVGPGRVLADLIESQCFPVVALTEIFRQARQSLIVVNAHRVRAGQLPQNEPNEGMPSDFFWIERDEPAAVLKTLKQLVAKRIPHSFGLVPREIQLLTPMQRGLLGASNLNAELQALLNPKGEEVARSGRLFRVGDRVMQIRNNYDLAVWNGDVGHIVGLDLAERQLVVDFDERSVKYELDDLDDLTLAYASSVHKAQGSEYPCVVIVIHSQHFALLERNLLYTALTRGRKLVVLVGPQRAIAQAVHQQSAHRRWSLLASRLRTLAGLPPVPLTG